MSTKKKSDEGILIIEPINTASTKITVESITPLITQRLTPKQVMEMYPPPGQPKPKHRERDYDAEYEACFYYTDEGEYGIIARAFMGACLNAATDLNIHKTQIKRSVRFLGEVYPLRYGKVEHKVDVVRNSGRNHSPDIRHRPYFYDWECDLIVRFDVDMMPLNSLVNLINRAGEVSGVGSWRPSSPKCPGEHGTFRVKPDSYEVIENL
jgi:hypothetical protein